jgi:hypothetical protein
MHPRRALLLFVGLMTALVVLLSRPNFWHMLPTLVSPGISCKGTATGCTIIRTTIEIVSPNCKRYIQSLTMFQNTPGHGSYTSTYGEIMIEENLQENALRAIVIHECGHIVDFFALHGTPRMTTTPFTVRSMPTFTDDPSLNFYRISWTKPGQKAKSTTSEEFVSQYAQTDFMEDFAETYTYFVLQQDAFEKRAKTNRNLMKKLTFIKRLFPSDFAVATGSKWQGAMPIAATVVGYEWNDSLKAAAPEKR